MGTVVIDLIGMRFGRLVVLSRNGISKHRRAIWECKCDCGNIKNVPGVNLRLGKAQSCGCIRTENLRNITITHGQSNTRAYTIWAGMVQRCHDKNSRNYQKYGARGITVCDAWRVFENFAKDMLPAPFEGATIDRKDNSKGYSADNCRWATNKEQQRNKRNNHILTIDGETKTLTEWCEHYSVPRERVAYRLRAGVSPKEALTLPVLKQYAPLHKRQ